MDAGIEEEPQVTVSVIFPQALVKAVHMPSVSVDAPVRSDTVTEVLAGRVVSSFQLNPVIILVALVELYREERSELVEAYRAYVMETSSSDGDCEVFAVESVALY
ncbi:TPA: hypothetical protein DCS99_01935 [Candidatus Wolfebacteria bacterium]|nr:hypothetical protein [Candidatus Wolfebacteria bacterium]